jgi:GT2 family glycosyltransferase
MIGIIITTFLRDELLFKCINHIINNWNPNYYVIIIEQGHYTPLKDNFFKDLKNVEYIKTEFDIGALQARNIGIKRIKELNLPYTIMSADSIIFKERYNFSPIIEFLEQEKDRFLCGFYCKNRIPWEADLDKTDRFHLYAPKRNSIVYKNIKFQPIDICQNFFLAKTDLLIDSLYDEDRKLADHESSFWRFKEKEYKCFYTKSIEYDYIKSREIEYQKYRNRFICSEKEKMKKKYNLNGWVKYENCFREILNKHRNRR